MSEEDYMSGYSANSWISSEDVHSTYSAGSGESNHTDYDPYTIKCDYCSNTHRAKLIQCITNGCNRYFCSNRYIAGTRTTHIISHLKNANHNTIKIDQILRNAIHNPKCAKCGTKNIFSLGFIKNSHEIVCRVPCLLSETQFVQFTFQPLVHENKLNELLFARVGVQHQRNPQNATTSLFRSIQNQISLQQVREIEMKMFNLNLDFEDMMGPSLRIRRRYESKQQYAEVFNYLLTLECFEENAKNFKMIYSQVKLYFGGEDNLIESESEQLKLTLGNQETNLRAMFFGYEIGCRFSDKDDILVKHVSGWDSNARIVSKDAGWFILEFQSPVPNLVRVVDMTAKSDNSTFNRLRDCLKDFLKKDIDEALLGAILGHQVESSLGFNISINDYTFNGLFQLNDAQINTIRNSLQNRVSIIMGPPGTGKTSTIVALIAHINSLCRPYNDEFKNDNDLGEFVEYLEKKINRLIETNDNSGSNDQRIQYYQDKFIYYKRLFRENYSMEYEYYKKISSYFSKTSKILICAPSNYPVFDLRGKLEKYDLKAIQVIARAKEEESKDEPGTLRYETDRELEENHRYLEIQQKMKDEKRKNKPDKLLIENYEKILNGMKIKTEDKILSNYNIVCCTCITSSTRSLLNLKFEFVVVDEATQALEPEIIMCILKGAKHLVLVGDRNQLGSMVSSNKAKNLGLSNSMFERFEDIMVPSQMLSPQYRMDPMIASFSNSMFYGNLIENFYPSRNYYNFEFPDPIEDSIFFYHISSTEEISGSGSSYVNRYEADTIVSLINYFQEQGVDSEEIGIITFYDGQKGFLEEYLDLNLDPEYYENIEVMSVDASQGREKGFIILSCVRSNLNSGVGFLNEYRRLNVAMTRAKFGLVVCGNVTTLLKDQLWTELIRFFDENELIFSGRIDALVNERLGIGQVLFMNDNRHGRYADDYD